MVNRTLIKPDFILHGPRGYGDVVQGPVLVSQHDFSARYDLDRERGKFSRKQHDLYDTSIASHVLVAPVPKDDIATSWMLREIVSRDIAPIALILQSTHPVMIQGAVLANISIMQALRPPGHKIAQTGDWLRIMPCDGIVEIGAPQLGLQQSRCPT